MKRNKYKKSVTKGLKKNQVQIKKETARKELNKEISKTNVMLKKLSREHKANTWASKKLYNRLTNAKLKGVWNHKTNRIRRKNLNMTQMTHVNKAISQFKASKTSTLEGIKSVRNETIQSLKRTLSLENEEITDEQAEELYNMLADDDFAQFAKIDKAGASTMWALIEEAQTEYHSEATFIDRVLRAFNSNDVDLRDKAKRIYNSYIL